MTTKINVCAKPSPFFKRNNIAETCFYVESGDEALSTPELASPLSTHNKGFKTSSGRFSISPTMNKTVEVDNPAIRTLKALVVRSATIKTPVSSASPRIPAKFRARIIDQLAAIVESLDLGILTLFRAVHIFDRFVKFSTEKMGKRSVQLVGIVSLRLAAKLEASHSAITRLYSFLNTSLATTFSKAEIAACEAAALKVVSSSPTELELILAAFEALELHDDQLKKVALRLARRCLLCIETRERFTPTEIAAYVLIYVLRALGEARDGSTFHEEKIREVLVLFAVGEENNDLLHKLSAFFVLVTDFEEKYAFLNSKDNISLATRDTN